MYLCHVTNAFRLLGRSSAWLTPWVKATAEGIKNGLNLSFRPPNFISPTDSPHIVEKHRMNSDIGSIFFVIYLFSLRVPSGTFPIRRAFKDDPITEFREQETKILTWRRTYCGQDLLVMKFSYRKNIKYGCILKRPCIFPE